MEDKLNSEPRELAESNQATTEPFLGKISLQTTVETAPGTAQDHVDETKIEFAPAFTEEYPQVDEEFVLENRAGYGEEGVQSTSDYLHELLPNEEFTLFSDEGSTAVIFERPDGVIFKVFRNSSNYSYVEREMANLVDLYSEGIAPKPHYLVDAGMQYRHESHMPSSAGDKREIQIPRINSEGKWPIIVMDKVEGILIHEVEDEAVLLEQFDHLAEICLRKGLIFGDTEIIYDTESKSAKLIDVGGIGVFRPEQKFVRNSDGSSYDGFPDISADEFRQAEILSRLANYFIGGKKHLSTKEVADILKESGMEAFHETVLQRRDVARESAVVG